MILRPLLRLCIIVRSVSANFFWASEDTPKPVKSAAKGHLKRDYGLFQLTGHAKARLTEVNGGRLCVNGFGKKPPGYYITGNIGLERCAQIAMEQPSPLGFRWGRPGFDYDVYTRYATPENLGGNSTDPIDLQLLFPDPGDFVCLIYVSMDSSGQAFTFQKSDLSKEFLTDPALKGVPTLKDGPARSMCLQRWTMTEFFKPSVQELWFCFMETTQVDHCDKTRADFYTQGQIFMCVFVFFLGVLGWIMADMEEFESPLVWFTRFLLNMELSMVSVAYLLTSGWRDTECPLFFFCAYAMAVAGAWFLFVPYYVMEHIREDCFFNTAYLLLLAFSPCFLMEFLSYWSHFILLVGHKPLLIGAISFCTSELVLRWLHFRQESMDADGKSKADMEAADLSADRGSYASVPQDEGQCGCRVPHKLISLDGVLDKVPHSFV